MKVTTSCIISVKSLYCQLFRNHDRYEL